MFYIVLESNLFASDNMNIWVKPICWKMFALISSDANLNCLDVPCSPPLGSNKGGTFIGISSKNDRFNDTYLGNMGFLVRDSTFSENWDNEKI